MAGCREVGISRQIVDYWSEYDAEFGAACGMAKREADDVIRSEIHRRAAGCAAKQ